MPHNSESVRLHIHLAYFMCGSTNKYANTVIANRIQEFVLFPIMAEKVRTSKR